AARASAMACCISATLGGLTTASTLVAFSCECTSLTMGPGSWVGIADAYGVRTGIGRATHAAKGPTASAAEALRMSRRARSALASPPREDAKTRGRPAHRQSGGARQKCDTRLV